MGIKVVPNPEGAVLGRMLDPDCWAHDTVLMTQIEYEKWQLELKIEILTSIVKDYGIKIKELTDDLFDLRARKTKTGIICGMIRWLGSKLVCIGRRIERDFGKM